MHWARIGGVIAVAVALLACSSQPSTRGRIDGPATAQPGATAPVTRPQARPAADPPTETHEPDDPTPPADWPTVDTGCHFRFRASTDFARVPSRNLDSCVVRYQSEDCALTGDFGHYSDDLSDLKQHSERRLRVIAVDGRGAKLVTFRREGSFEAAIHFPDVYGCDSGIGLTLWAECRDSMQRDQIVATLLSVRFTPRELPKRAPPCPAEAAW